MYKAEISEDVAVIEYEIENRLIRGSVTVTKIDNGHDFCLDIWASLGGRHVKTDDDYYNDDAIIYQFDAYDQFRHEATEPQLVRIFRKLESLGYIETFTLKPPAEDLRWLY